MTPGSPVTLDDDHVSPELALVDPDLAGRLRLKLPEPDLERGPPPPTQPPRDVDVVPRLSLAPPPVEEPEVVAEPVVVEKPGVVEAPDVVEEPRAFEESHLVAASGVLDEPHEVDEQHDDDDVGEAKLGGASLRVEPRPVDIGTPAPLTRAVTTTAAWPPVPDSGSDLDPERGRLRRLVFVFGVGMVVASLAVVGLVALFGEPDPPPPLTLAGQTPSPGAPQPGSSEAQGSSSPLRRRRSRRPRGSRALRPPPRHLRRRGRDGSSGRRSRAPFPIASSSSGVAARSSARRRAVPRSSFRPSGSTRDARRASRPGPTAGTCGRCSRPGRARRPSSRQS